MSKQFLVVVVCVRVRESNNPLTPVSELCVANGTGLQQTAGLESVIYMNEQLACLCIKQSSYLCVDACLCIYVLI